MYTVTTGGIRMTFLDFAEKVLEIVNTPLSSKEIWDKGVDLGLDKALGSEGKSPAGTLSSTLGHDIKKESSIFFLAEEKPQKYFLKSKKHELKFADEELSINSIDTIPKQEKYSGLSYSERDLHPLLSYFVHNNENFNRKKEVYTKTIYHEESKKTSKAEWLHPDMVGLYLPLEDWDETILEFNTLSDMNALQLYSFELKIKIDKSNYRESFFQALSNSSWAHQGYLVASSIDKDKDVHGELLRLSDSFGIGIIELSIEDIDASQVLFPASNKDSLDWETMNKLCSINKNFRSFIKHVSNAYKRKSITLEERISGKKVSLYDKIFSSKEEVQQYIAKKKMKNNIPS